MKNLSNTSLTEREKKAVMEFKERVEQEYSVVTLCLFGSKARSEVKTTSDVDLLLILEDFSRQDRERVYEIVDDILLEFGIDLSVKIFSRENYVYLKSIPSVFTQLVDKEAISI